jgi:hypothetical protein
MNIKKQPDMKTKNITKSVPRFPFPVLRFPLAVLLIAIAMGACKNNDPASAPTLSVDPCDITVESGGGTHEIAVTANVAWEATSPETFVTLDPQRGTGSGTISVTLPGHTATTPRLADITVRAGGLAPKLITVTQAAFTPQIALSPPVLPLPYLGGVGTVTLTANMPWEATLSFSEDDPGDWLTLSPSSGTAGAVLTLTAPGANIRGKARKALVTVTADGLSRQLIVQQAFIAAPAPPALPITHNSMRSGALQRYAWKGKYVALLTETNTLDRYVMKHWLNILDSAYAYYAKCTGREPGREPGCEPGCRAPGEQLTIASVPETCGAGCGYLGWHGVEIQAPYFNGSYEHVRDHNQFHQMFFYELGRNFWFFSNKIAYYGYPAHGVYTGFAVFMRFIVMDYAGAEGMPFDGMPFVDFKNTVRGLRQRYLDGGHTWENTLGEGHSFPNGYDATDLFASFAFYLMENYGGKAWVENVWRYVAQRPDAEVAADSAATTQRAVDNWIVASSQAANTNLAAVFEEWRWPVSDAVKTELAGLFP